MLLQALEHVLYEGDARFRVEGFDGGRGELDARFAGHSDLDRADGAVVFLAAAHHGNGAEEDVGRGLAGDIIGARVVGNQAPPAGSTCAGASTPGGAYTSITPSS